jgi:hypothetical protein
MNLSPENPNQVPQIYSDKFYEEFVRENAFKPYIGSGPGSIIQVREDLTRRPGDRLQFNFMPRLVGAGVRGHQVLRGNEELLTSRGMFVLVNYIRHAVAVDKWTMKKSIVDIMAASKPSLKNWANELFRADIISALQNVNGVPFLVATGTQQNQWLADNADRVQFGSKQSNASSGNVATALNTLTGTITYQSNGFIDPNNDGGRMTRRALGLAKRRAQHAHPRIRPVQVKGGGQEWFVAFLGSGSFRDLYNDPEMRQDLELAAERGKNNPLFTGGDLITQGIIVKEEYEFAGFPNTANTPVQIEQNVLCGAQALGYAIGQRFEFTKDTYDYGFENGIGVEEIRGLDKLRFSRNTDLTQQAVNLVDHGVYTMFNAAPADA